MANGKDFFQQMCNEALDEVAGGKKGWKEAEPNVLILACFAMLTNHLYHKITRPLWFFSCSVAAGVMGFIINIILTS